MAVRHFLSLSDLAAGELRAVVERAAELKAMQRAGQSYTPLEQRVMALVFEKSSTRTRVSFETAMIQMGGGALFLSPRDAHLGRGEPIEDTARVISRMVDVIALRVFSHETFERFVPHSRVPVINALSDRSHPCQLLADVQTFIEHRGEIKGRRVAWIGDANNMCNSYLEAAPLFGFDLLVACPEGYRPDARLVEASGGRARLVSSPQEAVREADLIVTDAWVSMGQEAERDERLARFAPFRVDAGLLAHARHDVLIMHCLPAHRGEEITAEALEGPNSAVWDEAENRLHAQKALLEFLLCD